jgi:RHS repeat-associated protein
LQRLPTHAFGQNTSYSANSVNEYTSINGGGFQVPNPTYDDNGNALTLPRPNGTSQSLTWDIHNRLRTSSQISNPQSQISFVYDPLGRLVWTRTTTPGETAVDEVWSWSGWTLLTREVLQGSNTLDTFRYTWGPDLSGSLEGAGGVGGLLSIEHAAGNSSTWDIRHVHYDANGNVIALTNSTGNISARYRYSPFGELISSQDLDGSGWNERNLHRFSTKPELAGAGLLYYGYRWYDPGTGRWPSRDPIEEGGGMNLYGFVGNSAVGFFDYLGQHPAALTLRVCIGAEGGSLTAAGVAAAFGLSRAECEANPKCAAVLLFLQEPVAVTGAIGVLAICKCKDFVVELAVPKKCSLKTQLGGNPAVSNSIFCTYDCGGSEAYLTLPAGSKCEEEVDFNDPRLDKPDPDPEP